MSAVVRVVRVRTGRTLAPWGGPVGDLRVLGVALRERQERVLRGLGLQVDAELGLDEANARAPAPGELRWDDDVDVTPQALRAFLRTAGHEGGRMAMLDRPARRGEVEVEPLGPVWGPDAEPSRLVGVRFGPREDAVVVPPRGFGGVMKAPGPFRSENPWWITDRSATTLGHWSHVLRANMAALPSAFGDAIVARPWSVLWTWLRAPFSAGGGRLAKVGRRCRIHPTARLEMCVLGDDVEVGAYSVLRGCVVADGARIEDHVTAKGAVVGPGAHVGNYGMVTLSVVGARSSVSHIGAQACVIGDDTFVATFATLMDLDLTGNVRVPFQGTLTDTGTPFLGVAVGHRVRMGAGTWVAQGRMVPNDVTLVAAPGNVLARVPETLAPGVYAVEGGRLVLRERSSVASTGRVGAAGA